MLAQILIVLYILKEKKVRKFLDVKITKWSHAYTGSISSDNVEILNSFHPKLQH